MCAGENVKQGNGADFFPISSFLINFLYLFNNF